MGVRLTQILSVCLYCVCLSICLCLSCRLAGIPYSRLVAVADGASQFKSLVREKKLALLVMSNRTGHTTPCSLRAAPLPLIREIKVLTLTRFLNEYETTICTAHSTLWSTDPHHGKYNTWPKSGQHLARQHLARHRLQTCAPQSHK